MTTTATQTGYQKYTTAEERSIAHGLLTRIFAVEGRSVRVSNGEEYSAPVQSVKAVKDLLAETGEDTIAIFEGGKRIGWVWLIWGNGEDLISDYSDNEVTRELVGDAD